MFEVIYIKPISAFPFPLHSDTLFGAICYGMKELFGEDEVKGLDKPKFLLSSAFPFLEQDNKKIHFFPKIIFPPKKISTELMDNAKIYKKARFIHESLFNKLLDGELSEEDVISNIDDYKVKNGILMPRNIDYMIFRISDMPRNVINRITNKSEDFFYTSGALFENGGVFFLIKYIRGEENCKKKIRASIEFLRDRGIGGDISVGKGVFSVEYGEIDIENENKGDFFVTLSLYSPTDEELKKFGKNMWYNVIRREGKCKDGESKKAIFMFGEGSIFPEIDKQIYGRIEKVRDSPQVFQYGLAFPLKVRINGD